jgi:DNA invertase Pin-like site-specific DNA recombinase
LIYGYARVSTTEQDTTLQLDALRRSGVAQILQEKRSSVGHRPKLNELLELIKPGDMIKVYKIDRLARSLIDLLSILDRIQKAGAAFQSLTEPVDTSTSAGRMMTHMLGAFAEFERGIIRERSIAGQTAAMMRGVKCGRPRSISADDEKEIVRLWQSKRYTMDSLAAIFNAHPSSVKRSIYRVFKPGHSSLN